MEPHSIHPLLAQPDRVVLELLLQHVQKAGKCSSADVAVENSGDERHEQLAEEISLLEGLNDETDSNFQPTVFTGWDQEDFKRLPASINGYILQPYIRWARTVVRRQTDVVFLTHIILHFTTSVPSAIFLYLHFSWPHAICHWVMQGLYCGPFTLLLHNHIHNNGVLVEKYALFDRAFPYILEPLMGHTWHSYYYHHLKCHHVEGNGPEDLSSTLQFQRDEIADFLIYLARFMFLIWIELPIYFIRKNKTRLAFEFLFWELASYLCMYLLARQNFYPTLFILIIPFFQMRIGLMVGNWAQHALVDDIDPDSDYRSSITLIDVAVSNSMFQTLTRRELTHLPFHQSNRHCFNDGWHTAHHLNPRRHWRDQPLSYLKAKSKYDAGRALVFHNIDYVMMFIKLMQKDYDHLAQCLVPTGENIKKSHLELANMLRSKTRKFPKDDIEKKFVKRRTQ